MMTAPQTMMVMRLNATYRHSTFLHGLRWQRPRRRVEAVSGARMMHGPRSH